MPTCPICKIPMVAHTNRDGTPFWGCSNYYSEGCRYTEPMKDSIAGSKTPLEWEIGAAIGSYDDSAIQSVLMKFEEDDN